MQINQQTKKYPTRSRRSDIIRKASPEEQQIQTTITTNISYIQNFISV